MHGTREDKKACGDAKAAAREGGDADLSQGGVWEWCPISLVQVDARESVGRDKCDKVIKVTRTESVGQYRYLIKV